MCRTSPNQVEACSRVSGLVKRAQKLKTEFTHPSRESQCGPLEPVDVAACSDLRQFVLESRVTSASAFKNPERWTLLETPPFVQNPIRNSTESGGGLLGRRDPTRVPLEVARRRRRQVKDLQAESSTRRARVERERERERERESSRTNSSLSTVAIDSETWSRVFSQVCA